MKLSFTAICRTSGILLLVSERPAEQATEQERPKDERTAEQVTEEVQTTTVSRRRTPPRPIPVSVRPIPGYSPEMFNRSTLMWIIIITTLNAARILLSES